jgi:hypothetical protein
MSCIDCAHDWRPSGPFVWFYGAAYSMSRCAACGETKHEALSRHLTATRPLICYGAVFGGCST